MKRRHLKKPLDQRFEDHAKRLRDDPHNKPAVGRALHRRGFHLPGLIGMPLRVRLTGGANVGADLLAADDCGFKLSPEIRRQSRRGQRSKSPKRRNLSTFSAFSIIGVVNRRTKMAKDEHNKAAEHHENAAKAHRSAAEHHGKGDHAKGKEHADAAKQHSQAAHQHTDQAHSKSQQQK